MEERFKVGDVKSLIIGLLCALVATHSFGETNQIVVKTTKAPDNVADSKDAAEKEYQELLEKDDAAQEEADRWIKDNQAFQAKGAGIENALLTLKIEQRFEPIRTAYENFLQRYPNHVRGRLAYGSFLNDTGKETEAAAQWDKARELDPKNPAAWNNLANYYGHHGPVTNAFSYYEKAIELNAKESVYYQNFATTVFLFRKDAMEFYKVDEQKVFDKALELYRKALQLDPQNFVLANDLAQSYYGIRPARPKEAVEAWRQALSLAKDDLQREGVYIHLARHELTMNQFAEARKHIDAVTNQNYTEIKQRLLKNLETRMARAATNATPATSKAP
jgi:tetratricopeptide (TPR) repeat protein